MRSVVAAGVLLSAIATSYPATAAPTWEPAIPAVPPGGFATVTVEGIRHGDRRVNPNVRLRFRSDKDRTAILVQMDGKYLTEAGRPFKSMTTNPTDVPQWVFFGTRPIEVPLTGLAPGVHRLQIRRGIVGASLPLVNEQDIWFSVGE